MKVEVILKSDIVFEEDFDSSITVRTLKEKLQDHLNSAFFQMYTRIDSIEVLMSESWDLAFFQSIDPTHLKIEIKQRYKEQEILEEAVSCCRRQDDAGLLFLFTTLSGKEREILLNKEIADGWTLLHFCCRYNMEEFIVLNHDYFRDFNRETLDGWTPLLLATANNCENIVNFLLEFTSILINKSTNTQPTALHIACNSNLKRIVGMLISSFADPSIEDASGKTALEYATEPELYDNLVDYVRALSLKRPMSNIAFEGLLWISSRFKKSKSVHVKINLTEGVLDLYEMNDRQVQRTFPMLRIGLRNIEKVRSVQHFDLFNKNYYFKIKYLSKKILFCHISKSYRDDWVNTLCNSIQEWHKCPVYEEYIGRPCTAAHSISADANEESFEFLKELGKGTYASVFKARLIETGAIYAIKKILKTEIEITQTKSYVKRECKILKKINHPFVITVRHIFQDHESLNLVLDYCSLGDLENIITPGGMDENAVRFYIAECLLALEYIQTKNIMHRDLKPANILIDDSGHIKLTDFGLSKEVMKLKDQHATFLGTPLYVPPENIKRKTLTHTYDLYSLGIMMFEFLIGRAPYMHNNTDKLFKMKTSGKLSIPSRVSVEAAHLLKKLLNKNPEKRPTISQAKDHPFFKGLDWEKLLKKEYKPPLRYFVKEEKGS